MRVKLTEYVKGQEIEVSIEADGYTKTAIGAYTFDDAEEKIGQLEKEIGRWREWLTAGRKLQAKAEVLAGFVKTGAQS